MIAFRNLPLGSVRPRGWLLAQLRRDLESGFAARLDLLTPHAARDLFRARIASSDSHLAWWDAETRGNWLWGYVMMAALSDLPEHLARSRQLVDDLLATQEDDGYIGIFSPSERYHHAAGENGELWGQSRALLALIAWHEATGKERVLEALRRAVGRTLREYSGGVPYFARGNRLGRDQITGLTHGLCYLDVLEWLHDRTGDAAYGAAGLRLYREFSAMPRPFPNDDMALPNLLEPHGHFGGHAVHTAEHLRAVLWCHSLAPGEVTAEALATAFQRLRQYRLPSGALPGDENIHGTAHPEAPYEFCTSAELGFSLASAVRHLGEAEFGDWLEILAFNAVQGARLADGSAIAYLSADTRLFATADRPDAHSAGAPGRRFKYSPTHDDVACCCNPNAVRFLPQFISRMWLRLESEPGFAALAYGPCELRAEVGGHTVIIEQQTGYPFDDAIELELRPERPVELTILLRRPAWAGSSRVTAEGASVLEEAGWWRVRKLWRAGDRVQVAFSWRVRTEPYANGEVAVMRGPLQYVQPVEHRLEAIRNYPVANLHDYDVFPADIAQGYRISVLEAARPDLGFTLERRTAAVDHPWDVAGQMLRSGATDLVPLGCTVLRRAAFPIRRRPASG
jgi:hypothetical protein